MKKEPDHTQEKIAREKKRLQEEVARLRRENANLKDELSENQR